MNASPRTRAVPRRRRVEPGIPAFALFCVLAAMARAAPSAAQTCAPIPPGLISWWPGDTGSVDIAAGNHGTPQGGLSFTPAKVGNGFTFSGNADGVVVPDELSLDVQAGGFTVDFWVRGTMNQPGPSLACVIEKSHGFVDQAGWAFQVYTASGLPAFAIGSPSGFVQIVGTTNILDGAFHHIAGTWGGGTMNLYVDGQSQGTAANAAPVNNARSLNMGFAWGGGTPQRFFRGVLDEVMLFDRALTPAEVQALYQAGGAGMCRPSGTCGTPLQLTVPSALAQPGDPNGRPAWVRTGVRLEAGSPFTIRATGDVNDGGGFSAGPDGNGFAGDPHAQFPDWYQSVAHLALIGRLRLASDTTQVMPLDDGQDPNGISGPAFVGSAFSATASATGTLELAVNDGDSWNNSGGYRAWICAPPVTGAGEAPPAGSLAVHPTPGRGAFQVTFGSPAGGPLRLQVYDVEGRLVRTLFDGPQPRGVSRFGWDGRDSAGRAAKSGVYMVRAESAAGARSTRLILIR